MWWNDAFSEAGFATIPTRLPVIRSVLSSRSDPSLVVMIFVPFDLSIVLPFVSESCNPAVPLLCITIGLHGTSG